MGLRKFRARVILSVLFVLTAVLSLTLVHPYFSSTEFCLSCHEMDLPYQEYKASMHFNNPSGVRAECGSCHIPEKTGPKLVQKARSVKELYNHFSGILATEEKFNQERPRLAKIVWAGMKANDSRECRFCHNQDAFVFAAFKNPKKSEQMQKGLKENQTCIDCHKGRVHKMPDLSSGFKAIYKTLEADTANPKITTASVYPITTVLCYNEKEGEREGRVLAATRLTVLGQDGAWLKVRADGWQQDEVDALIYELQGKRIFAVALDRQARENIQIHATMMDEDTEQVWHKVSFETWVRTDNMTGDLKRLWNYGAEMHGACCASCHSLTTADHFLANQWIGGLKDMKQYINLDTEEYRFLQKYLQLHARDIDKG